jgi:hypothetical protein
LFDDEVELLPDDRVVAPGGLRQADPGLAAHMVSGFTVAGVYGWIPRGRRDHYTG